MALPATDNFNRAAPLGANWTQALAGTVTINAGGVEFVGAAASDAIAFWNADSFPNDQSSECTITARSSSTHFVGVAVRFVATGSGNGYCFFTDGDSGAGHSEISKVTAGVFATLKAIASTFAVNDVIQLTIVGNTLTIYKNSILVDSVTDASSPFASGSAGIYAFNTIARGDNWTGDSFPSGPGPGATVIRYAQPSNLRRIFDAGARGFRELLVGTQWW